MFDETDPTYKTGYYSFNLVIDLSHTTHPIIGFPMNLIINPLLNFAPEILNVDCANFELEFELTYTC